MDEIFYEYANDGAQGLPRCWIDVDRGAWLGPIKPSLAAITGIPPMLARLLLEATTYEGLAAAGVVWRVAKIKRGGEESGRQRIMKEIY
jgi:hypothetical protein